MNRTRRRPLSSFLPWLLGSLAAHAALLAQWPVESPSGRQAAGGATETAVQVQLVRLQTTRPDTQHAANDPQPALAAVPRPEGGGAAAAVPRDRAEKPAPRPLQASPAPARGPSDTDAPASRGTLRAATAAASNAPAVKARAGVETAALAELTSLLHQAIDRHKRYPQSALRMGREGVASIDFRLGPDGRIDDLNIDASSGVRALDLAAYRAVEAIAPFQHAGRYLDSAQRFQVSVVFRIH